MTSTKNIDYGAGYDSADRRVIRAIKIYEEELLPFVQQCQAFAKSNFLSIKGYATGLREPDSKVANEGLTQEAKRRKYSN